MNMSVDLEPSIRDLVLRWMELDTFWQIDSAKPYQDYWKRWMQDKDCGICIFQVQSAVKILCGEFIKQNLVIYLVKQLGVLREPGLFERFLATDPLETEDFPPDDYNQSV